MHIGLGLSITAQLRSSGLTSVEASVALSAFSVVQNGADFDVAVTVTDDPDIPLDFYLVGIANGATAPSAAQIIAGTDSTDTAATIVLTFSTSVTGAQTETIATPADGTYDFYMVARDTDLDVSNTVTDIGVVFAAVATKAYTFLGGDSVTGNSSVQTLSLDIGVAAADRYILVAVEVQNDDPAPTSVTVGGVALSQVSYDNRLGYFGGIVATGAGAQDIVVTWTTANFQYKSLAAWRITGLASTTAKDTAITQGATNVPIAVDAGDFLFAYAGRDSDYSGSTETPARSSNITFMAKTFGTADWTITSTNAAFSIRIGDIGDRIAGVAFA